MFKELTKTTHVFGQRKHAVDYDFETLNPIDFQCTLKFKVERGTLFFIFESCKNMMKKQGADVSKASLEKGEFSVDPRYLRMIYTGIDGILKDVWSDVLKDGRQVYKDGLSRARFYKEDVVWWLEVVVIGEYSEVVKL